MDEHKRSGIILSGGKSSRLGQDKGLIELGGKPLVSWVIDLLRDVTDEIIVVVGSEENVPHYRAVIPDDVHVVPDCYPENSPLIGLISGLRMANGSYAVVCACDMPFVVPDVLELLFCISYGLNGSLLVKSDGWIESIPSVYNVSNCLNFAEVLRGLGEMRIRKVLENMSDTVTVSVEKLRVIDPDLVSFFDIDTLESYDIANGILLNKYK